MTDKSKKIKKLIKISLVVIAIVAITIVVAFRGGKEEKKQKQDTVILQRRTISNTITASGQIKAESSKSITSSSIGLKVASVNVKEGDKVEKGDLICTFDVSSIQKQISEAESNIAKAKKEIEENKENVNKAIENANKTTDEKIKAIEKQIKETKEQIDKFEKEFEDASKKLKTAQKDLENYKKTYEEELKKLEGVQKTYGDLQASLKTATEKYSKELQSQNLVQNTNITLDEKQLKELEEAKNKIEKNLADTKKELDNLKEKFKPVEEKYNEFVKAQQNADTEVSKIKTNIGNLKTTYDALNTSLETLKTNKTSNSSSIMNSSLSNSTISLLESELRALQKQVNESKVYSPIGGTVTSVNVSQGDTYIGTTIAKVEGMESYVLEAQIDEYDIPDVKIGQEVLIKTDATRDTELKGYISYVASAATENSSTLGDLTGITSGSILGSSSGATYKVVSSIDTETDRLRVGMTAKANIISEKKEDVLSLPYDAIQEDDDGNTFIEIVKSKDEESGELTTEKVNVELGIIGSYYSEVISDKIEAGMEVLVPKRDADSSLQAILDSMGSGAGI